MDERLSIQDARTKVLLACAAFSMILVFAYLLRPNNAFTGFLENQGINPGAAAFALVLSANIGPLAYLWFRRSWAIYLTFVGLFIYLGLLAWQVVGDPSASLNSLATHTGSIALFGILFVNAAERDRDRETIERLTRDGFRLQEKLSQLLHEKTERLLAGLSKDGGHSVRE